jgi:uncharacterized small protein (DUF1192 family)
MSLRALFAKMTLEELRLYRAALRRDRADARIRTEGLAVKTIRFCNDRIARLDREIARREASSAGGLPSG